MCASPEIASEPSLRSKFASAYSPHRALIFAGARRRNRYAAIGIFIQLVAQRADGDAEDVGGVRPVAEAMLQGLEDQVALHVGARASDQRPRHLFGGEGRMRDRRLRLRDVEPVAV